MVTKPNVSYTAPIGSIDHAADGYEIWPCEDCMPWHVEMIRIPDDPDFIVAREWHAVDCPVFLSLLEPPD